MLRPIQNDIVRLTTITDKVLKDGGVLAKVKRVLEQDINGLVFLVEFLEAPTFSEDSGRLGRIWIREGAEYSIVAHDSWDFEEINVGDSVIAIRPPVGFLSSLPTEVLTVTNISSWGTVATVLHNDGMKLDYEVVNLIKQTKLAETHGPELLKGEF